MVHKTPAQSSSRTSRVMRSVRGEDNAIDTGAARTATTGPGGHLHITLKSDVREASIESLNQILADTMTLRDLYKKHHWQAGGIHFYPMHLLFDKHFQEQAELVDQIAERIRILGGISVAMAPDVAQLTQIPRPPYGRESTEMQIRRLLEAHEIILLACHAAAKQATDAGDDGTNDLLVSDVIRTNEMQTWFVGEHLAPEPGDPTNDESR